jgi:Holliday junction DNA helicase RuvB
MAIERIVNTAAHDDVVEEEMEQTLRPRDFKSYIGQERLKNNLKLTIGAAKKRGEPIDHVLLYGPPGLGKTTMATVIANEMGAQIRVTSGPAIERAGDLASLLTNLQDGDILFIDEIHRLHRVVEEVLYSAMEDFKLDIMLGKGPSARSLRLDLPKFTIIGATTRAGSLAAPLRDRFGMTHRLDRHLLSVIMEHHNGGPVGVETLAALTSEERSTIEDFYEPYLMQIGLLERTPRGRKVTVRAWKHLGKSPINSTQPSLL